MKPRLTLLLLVLFVLQAAAFAQVKDESLLRRLEKGKEAVRPEEVVSFKNDVQYAQALQSLSELSKKFSGKIIVDPDPLKDKPIGVNIQSMYWMEAFELILRTNGRWYKEQDQYFQVILPPTESVFGAPMTQAGVTPSAPGTTVVDSALLAARSREVVISAVFLEINKNKLAESGVNFSIFRGKDLNLGVEFLAADRVSGNILGLSVDPTSRRLSVDVSAALAFFESSGLGEIIARPQVTVRSGMIGRVQVGEDFSIKQRDFAGNVTDQFYSTGTILSVLPKVYAIEGIDFIDLALDVERSSVTPDPLSIRVNKTRATSRLLLLDGEESHVGGLFLNEERVTREGVPVLKDLPWWVFGLRYIFGYNKTETARKELIVLIKAQLMPDLKNRVVEGGAPKDLLQKKLEEGREELRKKSQSNKQ